MKPTLTLTISQEATKEQIEKAVNKIYELKDEFAIIVIVEGKEEAEGQGNVSLPLKVPIFKGENGELEVGF